VFLGQVEGFPGCYHMPTLSQDGDGGAAATGHGRDHKWFSFIYERLTASRGKTFLREGREEIAGGAKGRVLEIGCGPGINFPYYNGEAVTELVATDPDGYMIEYASKRKAQFPGKLILERTSAEALPFPDSSFDAVVSILVLCTVPNIDKALSEVKRVLKPGGQFRFYEHVRYDRRFMALFQDLITPAWRWFGAGCRPNRDIARSMRKAGFEFAEFQFLKEVPPIPPGLFIRPHIKGIAVPGTDAGP